MDNIAVDVTRNIYRKMKKMTKFKEYSNRAEIISAKPNLTMIEKSTKIRNIWYDFFGISKTSPLREQGLAQKQVRCGGCGTSILERSRYCTECGISLIF